MSVRGKIRNRIRINEQAGIEARAKFDDLEKLINVMVQEYEKTEDADEHKRIQDDIKSAEEQMKILNQKAVVSFERIKELKTLLNSL